MTQALAQLDPTPAALAALDPTGEKEELPVPADFVAEQHAEQPPHL